VRALVAMAALLRRASYGDLMVPAAQWADATTTTARLRQLHRSTHRFNPVRARARDIRERATFSCAICFEERPRSELVALPCCNPSPESSTKFCRTCFRSLEVTYIPPMIGSERGQLLGNRYATTRCPNCRSWLHVFPSFDGAGYGPVTGLAFIQTAAEQRFVENTLPNLVVVTVLVCGLSFVILVLVTWCLHHPILQLAIVFVDVFFLMLLILLSPLYSNFTPAINYMRQKIAAEYGPDYDYTTEELAYRYLSGHPRSGLARLFAPLRRGADGWLKHQRKHGGSNP
jgi:hypothetical protein